MIHQLPSAIVFTSEFLSLFSCESRSDQSSTCLPTFASAFLPQCSVMPVWCGRSFSFSSSLRVPYFFSPHLTHLLLFHLLCSLLLVTSFCCVCISVPLGTTLCRLVTVCYIQRVCVAEREREEACCLEISSYPRDERAVNVILGLSRVRHDDEDPFSTITTFPS